MKRLLSFFFPQMPLTMARIMSMQLVIYLLWMGINLLWQVPAAFIVNAILGIYLFFIFPHLFLQQEEERQQDAAASSGPDSETLLETTCRHLEQMRGALEQVDAALGTLQHTHQSRFETLEEALISLVQDTQRRALRRERDAARKMLPGGSSRKNTQPLALRARAEEEELDDGQDHAEEA